MPPKEASSSRKRLEGVTSIAIAKADATEGAVHPEVRGDTSTVKEYDLTDEGDITDEDEAMETKGSSASEDLEAEPTAGVEEVDDKVEVESAKVEAPEVEEPEVADDVLVDTGNGDVVTGDEPVE